MTRHVQILESDHLRRHLPLLPRAVSHVAHAAIRNRGTLGGSLAYADPAAELPACAVALDATIVVAGNDGDREIKAGDFFTGLMQTALEAGELIVAVRFPVPGGDIRSAFAEFARRHGEFAVAGIAPRPGLSGGELPTPAWSISAALIAPKSRAMLSAALAAPRCRRRC